MPQVVVAPQALEVLVQELTGVAAALAQDTGLLAAAGAVAADEPGLVAALAALDEAWHDGLRRLADEAAATAGAVRSAARLYRQVEHAVAAACS